jgi:signal transduction histidine kinase/ActR/RegA family two-component response regulator
MDMRRLVRHVVARSLALVGVLAGAAFVQIDRLNGAAAWVDHTDRVIAEANLAQRLMIDKETGVRAFLLTREPAFLHVYEDARPLDSLDRVRAMVDQPGQAHRVAAVRQRYVAWLRTAEEALMRPEVGARREQLAARMREMDEIRALVAGFVAEEEALRAQRVEDMRRETRYAEIGTVLLLVLVAAGMAAASRRELAAVISAYDEALRHSAESGAEVAAAASRERTAREQAEKALKLKEEFLWTLSHELRTPLTAVLGWATVLRSRKIRGEALDRALATIERGARAEARIVDDLLDASRIAAGKVQLELAPLDLAEAVQAATDLCREHAEAKGVSLALRVEPGPAPVIGDAGRLQQVAWNLVANAVKFTPRGGHVTVRVASAGGRAVLTVEDDGDGIDPSFIPHLFERFRQADASMKRAHGGLGLGLSISRHFVELHGGTIRGESEGRGRGSRFTVSVPLAPPGERTAPAKATPPAQAARALEALRVLVVEDDPDSLALIAEVLHRHGAEVSQAALGDEALRLLGRERFDLIVSDIGLPDIDGHELLRRARATPAEKGHVPALALTAYAEVDDVARAHRAGFERHLAKPFSPDRLVAAVADLTSRLPPEPAGTLA